jgi:hypothetical protein
MKSKVLPRLLFVLLSLPLAAFPAEVALHASLSKNQAQLGESLVYTLTLNLQGQTQFSPQLELPRAFPGFQVRQGPQQQQSMNWVNGSVSQNWTWEWELAPLQSGLLRLPRPKVTLKDPNGPQEKSAEALSVQVAKGKSLVLQPTPTAEAAPTQTEELRPLKADLGIPWLMLGGLVLALAAPLSLLLWWLFRKPAPKPAAAVEREAGQLALYELEQARRFIQQEDPQALFLELSRILRRYLKQRLRVEKPEPTLLELRSAALKSGPEAETMGEALEDLGIFLFAHKGAGTAEAEALLEQARQAVLAMERNQKGRKNADERFKKAVA